MLADSNQKKLLNLGCGLRSHDEWVNLDFTSKSNQVIAHNLLRGIPYPDNIFDVVYHSHLLEHFTKTDAKKFINECHRVLKSGGIIRVAVPDLEVITKNYLKFLELSLSGDLMAKANYDWTMLEMYDQCARNQGGGEMKKYFKQANIYNKDFIKERMGYFFELMTEKKTQPANNNWKKIAKRFLPIESTKAFFKYIKNKFPGEKYRQLGKFRMSGEIHQWMYDRFSLARLLKTAGFKEILQRTASDSYIEKWTQYNIDTEPNGVVYKPDSLFMEAKKII